MAASGGPAVADGVRVAGVGGGNEAAVWVVVPWRAADADADADADATDGADANAGPTDGAEAEPTTAPHTDRADRIDATARVAVMHGRLGEPGRGLAAAPVDSEPGGRGSDHALRAVGSLRGRLMPAGLAAEGATGVLLFREGAVVRLEGRRVEQTGLWRYERSRLPSLPTTGRAGTGRPAGGRWRPRCRMVGSGW
jgi:hypothetical protein